jgi:hypothetical protein
MPKSLLYVPGLARPDLIVKRTTKGGEIDRDLVRGKIKDAFRGDDYMVDMVETIQNKGAIFRDCCQSLRWIRIPTAAQVEVPTKKVGPDGTLEKTSVWKWTSRTGFKVLEDPNPKKPGNILPLEPGVQAKPMKMGVGFERAPCTAPEYLAQPLPPSANPWKTGQALAYVAKGDTLYIVGHSDALGGALTYKCPALNHVAVQQSPTGCKAFRHAERRHIDPVTLGSLMINEGLPAGVVFDVALVACYSGGLDDPQLQTVQCFAQRLAGTLSARGYRCHIYGATGLTTSDKKDVKVREGATKQPNGEIVFDTLGEKVLSDGPGRPFYRRFFRFYR